ncbi:ACT domain-containing protein [uncultured Ferrimonas sp.]|uniref:glycine cleavage system protein R n=1 Tax=uncultured Ferrimonas sp. TaxID=432640 RepID=UPI00263468E6|nr:ACT domain-containing protein [uncultured Ferrimonas sp.]
MDTTTFIICVDGPDQPGMLNALSHTLTRYDGLWLTSKVNNLDGRFAALIRAQVPSEQFEPLQQALLSLESVHLRLHPVSASPPNAQQYRWNIESDDKPSLVQDITTVLHNHGANIEQFNSHHLAIAESGMTAFSADLLISAAASLDPLTIQQELKAQHGNLIIHPQN